MTKDYVRSRKKRQRQAKRTSFLLVALLFSVLMLGLGFYTYFKHDLSITAVKEFFVVKVASYFPPIFQKPKPHAVIKKVTANTAAAPKPIHFNFYDELPKVQLEFSQNQSEDEAVATPPTEASADLALKEAAPSELKRKEDGRAQTVEQELASDLSSIQAADASPYILQISIFHNLEVANRYRAALASAGLKVDVVKLRIGKEVVYRLQQGPYQDLDQLKIAKKRLTERGIACDVRKAAPYQM